MSWAGRFLRAFRSALERGILGLSAEEIRYTIDDVRAEIRATRTELLDEIAKLRAEVELLAGGPHPLDPVRPERAGAAAEPEDRSDSGNPRSH